MLFQDNINNKIQKRISYIDIFRSFGIIFMVMGHIGYGKQFDFFIHAFHMPMFFWISGYLFQKKYSENILFKHYVLKKVNSLLIPYIIFGIAHYLLYSCITVLSNGSFNIKPLFHLFSINTNGLAICGAIWFLTALFFTDVLYFIVTSFIINEWIKLIITLSISLVGIFISNILPFSLPFALGQSFVGIGLYYIGSICYKYKEKKIINFILN